MYIPDYCALCGYRVFCSLCFGFCLDGLVQMETIELSWHVLEF